jgi:hypothetical protein
MHYVRGLVWSWGWLVAERQKGRGSGLSGDRLHLVHRYMTEEDAAAEPPAQKRERWKPPLRDAEGADGPTTDERQGFVQRRLADAVAVARRTIPSADGATSPTATPEPAPTKQRPEPVAPPVEAPLAPERVAPPKPVAKTTPDPEPAVTEPEPNGRPKAESPLEPVVAATEAAAQQAEVESAAEEPRSAGELPIHQWVNAGAGYEPDPDWPQELVRAGLERSRRARRPDPDESYF